MVHSRDVRKHALDGLGIALALALGMPSLAFPFGRDQALWFYVGQGWLHGEVPYRDTYDFKPPGIFALYALTVAAFGKAEWPIRVLELLGLGALAWLVARLVRRDAAFAARAGEAGAVAVLLVASYFTMYGGLFTAQTELWEALALFGAYFVAERGTRLPWAAAVSGALVAIGALFKFPGALLGFATLGVLVLRARHSAASRREQWRQGVLVVCLHVGAGAATMVIVASYFIAAGAWPATVEILVWHLLDYGRNVRPLAGWIETSVPGFWTHPFVVGQLAVYAIGVALALRRRASDVVGGAASALLLLLFSFSTVVMQGHYAPYHYIVTAPFLTLCAGYGIAELARLRPGVAFVAVAVWAGLGVLCFRSFGQEPFAEETVRFWKLASGRIDRDAYLDPYRFLGDFGYLAQRKLSKAIVAEARPGDQLQTRGYEPLFYYFTGLRSPSRFEVEVPLFMDGLIYHHDVWIEEHDRRIFGARVRFIVQFLPEKKGVDKRLYQQVLAHGYHELTRDQSFVVLERDE